MSWQDTRTKARRYEPVEVPGETPGVEIIGGASTGRFIPLGTGTHTIGRARDAAVQLADDSVSRHHARLKIDEDGAAHVQDLESRNGTYLNDERVRGASVQVGDRIQIGTSTVLRFVIRVSGSDAAVPSTPGDDVLLSPRELEVARLVAEGCTNAEIAKELDISRKTVGAHMANIFERLGIHKRAQLARYITERGLLTEE